MQGNIARGELSSAQLETVIYANQRFQAPQLPDGSRPGFFLGDGAGVGKGALSAPCIPIVTVSSSLRVPCTVIKRSPCISYYLSRRF